MRAWPGTVAEGLRTLRYLHIGDCNFRCMPFAHDTQAPPGYPLEAAKDLQREGIGMEFAHYFCVNFDYLPTPEKLLRHARLSGPPDVISLQIGGNYTRWIVIPDTVRTMQMRVEIGRRYRRVSRLGYRAMHPVLRRFGRPAALYPGIESFEEFVRDLKEMWPQAQVIIITPFPRLKAHPEQLPISERVDADMRAVADRIGGSLLDAAALVGTEPGFRGASAYHANASGSEVLGHELARHILEGLPTAERRSATSVSA